MTLVDLIIRYFKALILLYKTFNSYDLNFSKVTMAESVGLAELLVVFYTFLELKTSSWWNLK